MADECCRGWARNAAWLSGTLGSLLVLGGLAWLVAHRVDSTPLDAARGAERAKVWGDVKAAANDAAKYGVVDGVPNVGNVFRLPVDRAMELVATEWKDGAAGREKMLSRWANTTNKPSFE